MNTPTEKLLEDNEKLPEVSIVMPCLNEADTLATCIATAARALSEHQIAGEIIVADNGSTDGSQDISRKLNARLVNVRERGYGSALMGGIDAAWGKFVVMADADNNHGPPAESGGLAVGVMVRSIWLIRSGPVTRRISIRRK